MEETREPCPWRILDDCGGAFIMGAIGGSIFHFISGAKHAPSGVSRRAFGGLARMKERGPMMGGQFGVWCICFASFDCTLAHLRGKQDPWNTITSGAATGALLSVRSGPKNMVAAAVIGGMMLSMIEGVGIMWNRWASESFRPVDPRDVPQDPQQLNQQ